MMALSNHLIDSSSLCLHSLLGNGAHKSRESKQSGQPEISYVKLVTIDRKFCQILISFGPYKADYLFGWRTRFFAHLSASQILRGRSITRLGFALRVGT